MMRRAQGVLPCSLRVLRASVVMIHCVSTLPGPLCTTPPFMTNPTFSNLARSASASPFDRDDVGVLARRDRADPVLPAHEPRGRRGSRTGSPASASSRSAPCRGAGGRRTVGIDPAVGAVGDLHPGRDRLPEPRPLGLGGLVVLPQVVLRPLLLPARRWRCSRRCRCRRRARCPAPSSARSPSSSISEPCSIDRTPARTARLIPRRRGRAPRRRRRTPPPAPPPPGSPASVYSETPGLVPRVRTAPVAMILMKSAPPLSSARTRSRTSSAELATPKRNSAGTVTSPRGTDHLAASGGDRDVRARHRHPRADHGAGVDRVAQRRVHERPIGPDVPHRGEPGQQGRPRVLDAGERLLRSRALERQQHVGEPDLADQVGVAVDEARQDGVAGEIDHPRAGRDRLAGGLDAPRSARPGPGSSGRAGPRPDPRPPAGRHGWPSPPARAARRGQRGQEEASSASEPHRAIASLHDVPIGNVPSGRSRSGNIGADAKRRCGPGDRSAFQRAYTSGAVTSLPAPAPSESRRPPWELDFLLLGVHVDVGHVDRVLDGAGLDAGRLDGVGLAADDRLLDLVLAFTCLLAAAGGHEGRDRRGQCNFTHA